MNLLALKTSLLTFSLFFLVGCTKYVAKPNTSISSGNQGATPLPPIYSGNLGSSSSGGSGSSGNSGTGSSNASNTADAIYIQGFYLLDVSNHLSTINASTYETKILEANGYYTKFASGIYKFWDPQVYPQNHSNYVGESNFSKNGYYSAISNVSSPGLVVLNNGNIAGLSTTKAYLRFINITDSAEAISINFKLSNSNSTYYSSYRKPYDFYVAGDIRASVYNQNYNSNAEFMEINPGSYYEEIYLSNYISFTATYNFIGGRKYTILVKGSIIGSNNTVYSYNTLQHNN